MKINPIEWINELVGGLVYLVFGYLAACWSTLLRPFRGPLALLREAARPDTAKLTSTVVLFVSALLASACIAWAGYNKLVAEATRMATNGARAGDYRLLVVAIVALVIFAACDLAARTPTAGASRKRAHRVRRLALRQYQIAAAIALVCALFAVRELSLPWLPRGKEPGAWIRAHQWLISAAPLLVVLAGFAVRAAWRRRLEIPGASWRAIAFLAPAVGAGSVLFYALSDLPYAPLLRRPEQALSRALLDNISDRYPTVTQTECAFTDPDQLEVTSAVVNRGKYLTLVDLKAAQVGFAQGWTVGYADPDVAWFLHPAFYGLPASAGTTRFILIKPGDAAMITVRFQNPKAYKYARGKYDRWFQEARDDPGYPYLLEPYCYLGLRMHNLELGSAEQIPDFNTQKDYWAEFRRTAGGEIVVLKAPMAPSIAAPPKARGSEGEQAGGRGER